VLIRHDMVISHWQNDHGLTLLSSQPFLNTVDQTFGIVTSFDASIASSCFIHTNELDSISALSNARSHHSFSQFHQIPQGPCHPVECKSHDGIHSCKNHQVVPSTTSSYIVILVYGNDRSGESPIKEWKESNLTAFNGKQHSSFTSHSPLHNTIGLIYVSLCQNIAVLHDSWSDSSLLRRKTCCNVVL